MKTAHYILPIFITLLGMASCKSKPEKKATQEEVIPVKVISLQQETQQQEIVVAGQFTTDDETILSFKNGGIVSRIYVKEGDAVKAGQVLATLDKTEISALSQQADIGLQKAQRDYNRASNLYKDSVATLEQLQNARTALDIAKQQFISANYNRNTTEIRATKSGYVLKKFANEGQVVGAGTPILQTNGASNGKWILKGGVSDNQWAAINIGNNAVVTTDAMPQKNMYGKVIKKSEGIDPMTGTFTIQIQINESDGNTIAAGLFGKATVATTAAGQVWFVPYEAVLDGDQGNGYVFVSNDGKTVKKQPISIRSIEHKHVVVENGLQDVRYLITTGNAYLKEGANIKIIP